MLPFCERTVSFSRAKYLPAHNRGIPIAKQPKTIGEHLRRRRVQLQLHQSQGAKLLKVSTVTLSRWERDHTYPTWDYHETITKYLGYDAFAQCGHRDPYRNETPVVASLSPSSLCQNLKTLRLELKLTLKECSKELNVAPKTLHTWEIGARQPCRKHREVISGFLNSRIASPFTRSPNNLGSSDLLARDCG